jgi:hypothetical protein
VTSGKLRSELFVDPTLGGLYYKEIGSQLFCYALFIVNDLTVHNPTPPIRSRYSHKCLLRPAWLYFVFSLVVGCSLPTSLYAGCFPGDNYHDFHHGRFVRTSVESFAANEYSLGNTAAKSWVYEDGVLKPIQNPLPPTCDGSGCRSNPNDQTLGVIPTPTETTRVIFAARGDSAAYRTSTSPAALPQRSTEAPISRFISTLDRPPKR